MIRSHRMLPPDARRLASELAWRVREHHRMLRERGGAATNEPARDAARFLDGCLVALAREEARSRWVLGRLLAAFSRRGVATKLGFVRMSDYARERLGVSGSEADVTHRVVKRLDALPLLRDAFLDGRISWTKARILAATATAESEARWLALAAGRTVRELEELVAKEGAVAAQGVTAVREDDDVEVDGEPRARFRMRAPGWAWLLFRRVVELARSVAGEANEPVWKLVEAITAEGLGAAPADAFSEDLERELAWLSSRRRPRRAERGSGRLGALPAGEVDLGELLPRAAKWLAVDEDVLRRMLPAPAAELSEDAVGLTPIALDARLRGVTERMRTVDVRMGRALELFSVRGLHRELGFLDLEAYVTERLGIGLRKARSLIALERAAAESAPVRAAYDDGRLSWVRAIALLPVVRDGRAAEPWVERATRVPVRRLVDEVSWALESAVASEEPGKAPLPPPIGARLEPVQMRVDEAGGKDAKADHVIEFWGPASVVTTLERLAIAWSEPREAFWKGLVRLLAAVARQWLAEGRRHKERIVARDGYRCIVPCCSSRRNLQVHHIIFRSQGGGDEDWNRGALCAGHHHQCLHTYDVVARGRAPDAIEWEFGAGEPDSPLMRIRGEVYA